MRVYKLEQWYKIPEKESVILNTQYLCGKHRFVKRTRDLHKSYNLVRPLLNNISCECWNVGTGYAWEPQGSNSYFLAVSMEDPDVALQFELTFC